MRLFEPGKAVITKAVDERYWDDHRFRFFINVSVGRHLSGDWGEVTDKDKKRNNDALENGGRLVSSYIFPNSDGTKEKIFIITEADRSSTTVMMADEY